MERERVAVQSLGVFPGTKGREHHSAEATQLVAKWFTIRVFQRARYKIYSVQCTMIKKIKGGLHFVMDV